MEGRVNITKPNGPQIKKGFHYYASSEYPKLYHGATYLISKAKGKRLLEYRMEILHKTEGYEPGPETVIYRELQRRYWWWPFWTTVQRTGIMISVNTTINEYCNGATYYWKENPWTKYGLDTFETHM